MSSSDSDKALRLFHDAAERVPAYKDFLKKARIDHRRIRTLEDFAAVPSTDAKNYIAAYPIEKRCWDGKLSGAQLIATSSGTTGEPKFWPRMAEQDLEAAKIHEQLFRNYFGIEKRTTLVLIGYPMGVYVSGMATVLPSWLVARKYPGLTIMSIGNNKVEILRAVRHVSAAYEQTVLIGHPFFIKDVIETGAEEGIVWRKKNIGMMFCSGSFSEAWRDYVARKAGISASAMRIFNTYGSSEMLLMGYESPFSIGIKRKMEEDQEFLKDLTGELIAPQVFEYNPELRFIETVDRELIFTSASGIPLIRFNLHDRGMTIPLKKKLPLIAFWGRSDDTLKFHAVNIYPEHVKAGLMEKQFLRALTGKFVMRKLLGKKMDEKLEINVELTPEARISKRLEQEIADRVTKKLRKINLEYMDMSSHLGVKTYPKIVLRPYQDPHYFKPGLKPRYIDRSTNK
jgi:phenylacetate-CoA ligase